MSKQFKQESITTSLSKFSTGANAATQKSFEQSLIEMLVEDMQPIASVERSGFQQFCTQVAPYCILVVAHLIEDCNACTK